MSGARRPPATVYRIDFTRLVNGTVGFAAIERGDDAFDLPPVTKTHHIAFVAAPPGACRRLEHGILAEILDQLGRIVERMSTMDEGKVHVAVINSVAVSRSRSRRVNAALTIALADHARLCHEQAMIKPDARAGGCFLSAFIIGGLVIGVLTGNALRGAIVGTLAGILVAILIWVSDRGNRKP